MDGWAVGTVAGSRVVAQTVGAEAVAAASLADCSAAATAAQTVGAEAVAAASLADCSAAATAAAKEEEQTAEDEVRVV